MAMATAPTPFKLHVPDEVLADLRERLARTRWPDEPPLPPWSTGTSVACMKALAEYWRTGFDWRVQEAALNAFAQFKVPMSTAEGGRIELHFIHERGVGPAPMPLLLSHGWPGSVFEFCRLIPMLTDPARFGGDARDAFTVVAPSLPGYGLSFAPCQQRLGVEEIADVFARLMSQLGYPRYGAQGGDWGAFITSRLGRDVPDRLLGIHLNLLALRRDPQMLASPSAEERRFLAETQPVPEGGDRLPVDPGHEAADARLRPHRFACRPGGLDGREIPRLDRPRRRPDESQQRSAA
jgi:microsomal epoxide hydrolase